MASRTPIRVGFVGLSSTGWAGIALAPPLLTTPLNEKYMLTAISTSRASSAEETAKTYTDKSGRPVKAFHGSTTGIASDPDVDLVAVAVKAPDHKSALLPVLEQKKDVFVEWPLGKNLGETIELAEMARRAGVRTMIGMQAWQNPVVLHVRKWIAEGKIGRVLAATYMGTKPAEMPYFSPNFLERDSYTLDPDNGATMLSIVIGHHLSAITRMVGSFSSLSATTGKWLEASSVIGGSDQTVKHTFPDHFSVTGSLLAHEGAVFTGVWRGGVPVTGANNAHRPNLLFIIDGEKGCIRIEGLDMPSGQMHLTTPTKVYLNDQEISLEADAPYVGNTGRNWAKFAEGAQSEYPSWDDAVVVHKHVDAIWRSSQEGKRVYLDL
ncbi:NAD-binding Rossmann fold oxidoreductase [Auriculariales sp. MPI-PUGE-AT-0066]|nr:NAD-binding Rossmann fold oxidoreductase [Auriculariales sp. MPI-PUGE-AT-0066]